MAVKPGEGSKTKKRGDEPKKKKSTETPVDRKERAF